MKGRLKLVLGLVLMLTGTAVAAVGTIMFTNSWNSENAKKEANAELELARSIAFLAGYDAAFALAKALQGKDVTQDIARIDAYLERLEVGTRYPANLLGPDGDAAPAADFASAVTGALVEDRTRAGFVLGWYGVILTNTPSLARPDFSVREYARMAGFGELPDGASDTELVEHIAEQARNEVQR